MTAPDSLVALSAMRDRARELANMETGAGTTFVPDAEANKRLNEAARYVYDLLIRAGGNEYAVKTSAAIPTVSGTDYYALPVDFYQSAAVILQSGNDYVDLPRWQEHELADLLSYGAAGGGSNIWEIRYRITGAASDKQQRLSLRPTPRSSSWNILVRYYPVMPALAIDADTFEGVNGWEHLVCLLAARAMLVKEESDPSALDLEIGRQEDRIAQLAGRRDAGAPARIADTRRDAWGSRSGPGWWPSRGW